MAAADHSTPAITCIGALAGLAALSACNGPGGANPPGRQDAGGGNVGAAAQIAPRTAVMPNYPCSQCHERPDGSQARQQARQTSGEPLRPPDPRVRTLEALHQRIELRHGDLTGWCYRCHSLADIDELELPDQSRVSYDESDRHCGACHEEQHADWRMGIHGLRTGRWDGASLAQSCCACHDPHTPKYPAMTPLPPPKRPRTVTKGAGPEDEP